MFYGMIISPGTVEKFAATKDCAVSEIHPKVIHLITFGTLPASWWYLDAIVELLELHGVFRNLPLFAIPR